MLRDTLVGVLLLTIFAIALPWPASAETRIALVIGNSAYPSGPLGSPKDDAKAVEAKLKALGFQVTRKTDLGREGFFNAIRDFGDGLQQPGTVGLFYYSGHGMQVNNRNYMIPTDADIRSDFDVARYAVPVEDVLVRMELGKSNPNIVIFDACRNNPFEKRFKSSQDGLAQIDAPPSTLIVFAAAPGRVTEAGLGGKLSPYTEALVEHIDQPYLTFVSMFQAVQNAVYERSGRKQSPRLELPPGLPAFSFKPMVAAIPPPAPVPLPAPPEVRPAPQLAAKPPAMPTALPENISNDVWEKVPDMDSIHSLGGMILLDSAKVLVATGQPTANNVLRTSELFDSLSKVWDLTGNINHARASWGNIMVKLNDGGVMLIGGEDKQVASMASVELYDPSTGHWGDINPLNTPRRGHAVIKLRDGKVLVAGGANGPPDTNRFLASTEIYDPLTGGWTYSGNLNVPREGAPQIVLLHDGRAMIAGGYYQNATIDKADIYDPKTKRWTATKMPYAWDEATMTVLTDGRVLVAGGLVGHIKWPGSDLVVSATAILYDPKTDTWAYTSHMHDRRSYHSAIVMSEGKVLVMGGFDRRAQGATPEDVNSSSKSAEVYDPSTGQWTRIANMHQERAVAVGAVALRNGNIFVVGGLDASGSMTKTAEMFMEDYYKRLVSGASAKER